MKINWKNLIVSIAISVGVGVLSGFLTMDHTAIYLEVSKPILSPPIWVFPLVWNILFVLMGISAYLIFSAEESQERTQALWIYGVQLLFNFGWPILFFNVQNFLWAFVLLIVLWILILLMKLRFAEIDKLAAKLQMPYLVWVTFAGYLNLMIYLLNR